MEVDIKVVLVQDEDGSIKSMANGDAAPLKLKPEVWQVDESQGDTVEEVVAKSAAWECPSRR